MTFGDQCSEKSSSLFWKLIVWFTGRFTLVVSNNSQVSFYLVSRVYHTRNCKHLPPVSSFLESVECADLLNQGTVFPEPTYIPAQQMRLGFCHGHYINFKRITAMPTFRLFHFCGRQWKLVQPSNPTVANMGQRELNRKCITKVPARSQRVRDLELVIWLRRSAIRLGETTVGTRQNVGMLKLMTGLPQIFSSVDFVPICANKSFKLLETTKLVIDWINWFR